eukprot:2371044-Amphidinium_carterae.1
MMMMMLMMMMMMMVSLIAGRRRSGSAARRSRGSCNDTVYDVAMMRSYDDEAEMLMMLLAGKHGLTMKRLFEEIKVMVYEMIVREKRGFEVTAWILRRSRLHPGFAPVYVCNLLVLWGS